MKKLLINRLGIEIDFERIKNPKLIRVIREREREFLFNYGDHEDHNDRHSDYKDHSEYGDHTDISKKEKEKEEERQRERDFYNYFEDYSEHG